LRIPPPCRVCRRGRAGLVGGAPRRAPRTVYLASSFVSELFHCCPSDGFNGGPRVAASIDSASRYGRSVVALAEEDKSQATDPADVSVDASATIATWLGFALTLQERERR